jgi:5-oxoprolinase (ATP-hydrolysing) subunit A
MDINCDMGESFGAYHIGSDAVIMPFISSANIACGFHAGDPVVMDATIKLAFEHGVSVGAHPGYADLQGFGRRNMDLTPEEVEAFVLYQVGALAGFAHAHGGELSHIKPHGALYNQAAGERSLALAIARGTARFSRSLVLVGLAGSLLVEMGREAGLRTAAEAFADRAYNLDGSLRSRRLPGALIETPQDALNQALRLVNEGVAITRAGQTAFVAVDTLCIHGDNPSASQIAQSLRQGLEREGIAIHSL